MYLKEIQGLRVIAALLVAIYHIWFHRVSGGVDAFFVVSGFFICRAFFDAQAARRTDLLSYYRRTFARIVPSASTVIVATCLGFLILDMDSLWVDQIKSAIASLFFVENWRLAISGADYLRQGQIPSPFQQMWALSVQVQIYLVLPPVLLGLWFLTRPHRHRQAFPAAVLIIAILAFAYAVRATAIDQPRAYFDTFARLWEVLAGVLMALWLPRAVLAPRAAKILGYACLAILTGFAAIIPVGQSFPGLAALVPVLATCGIMLAAINGADLRLLNARPMQRLGDLSFTFYLWHWPLLISWRLMTDADSVGIAPGLAIILGAGILSWITHALAEQPFRRSRAAQARPILAFAAIALVMLPAALAAGAWASTYVMQRDAARRALVLFQDHRTADDLVPATIIAKSDIPDSYRDGCTQRHGRAQVLECTYGNPEGRILIVLAGGSHSLHWLPALQDVARRDPRIRIIAMTKGNCPLTLSERGLDLTEKKLCLEWSGTVVERILQLRPNAVVSLLTSTREGKDGFSEHIPPGFPMVWSALDGISILAIRDTPRSDFDVVSCVDRLGPQASGCDLDRDASLDPELDFDAGLPANIHPLDLTEIVCAEGVCPAVRDNILVYRDHSHFTASYATVLAPHIHRKLHEMGVLTDTAIVRR